MTTLISDSVSVICLNWAAHSSSLTLLLFSLSEMTMRTSLLHTEQWAVWSRHLQLPQHSLKCFDIQRHSEKSVISCAWQLIQSSETNTLWLWIKITLMYNNISKRVSYHVPDSWHNQQTSTHSDSELRSHLCTMINEFSPDLMWCVAVQTEHSHWAAQEWLLSEKSECTEWAAVDQ